jgi:hypothetical protein
MVAKKRLKIPDVPIGPQYDFFVHFQDLVRHHTGDASLKTIVEEKGVTCSRQALYLALTGPDLPRRDLVREVATQVGSTSDEVAQLLRAYDLANDDQINYLRSEAMPSRMAAQATDASLGLKAEARESRERFSGILRQARTAANEPSLRQIELMGRRLRPPVLFNRSTLSAWFTGKSIPADWDTARTLYRLLLRGALQARRRGRLPTELQFRETWEAARFLSDSLRGPRRDRDATGVRPIPVLPIRRAP